MQRQGNMSQVREQEKLPEEELGKREASNLSDVEFKKKWLNDYKDAHGT